MIDDREIFALKNFVGIMSDCCRRLVEDILRGNPDASLQTAQANANQYISQIFAA